MTADAPRELHQHRATLNRDGHTPTGADPWAPTTASPETRGAHDRAIAELAARNGDPVPAPDGAAGSKVLLVGDPHQLPAVPVQGVTADICRVAVQAAADAAAEAALANYVFFTRGGDTPPDTGDAR